MDVSLSSTWADNVNDARGQRRGWIAALTLAVTMHLLMLVAALALHVRSNSLQSVSAGHGLRVTLTAAARPAPVPPKATPAPRPLKPTPSKAVVLASRHPAKRAVVTSPTHQTDAPAAVPAEVSPSESTAPSTPAPAAEKSPARMAGADAAAPLLNLPVSQTAVEVAHIECDIPQPPYPPHARRLGQAGGVKIGVTIGTTGRVTQVEVARSSGFDELDAAARDAMLAARCKPYVDHGVAVAVHALQSIEFNLNN
ncbi:TonB family protein [Burkholderia stagnalis]